MQRTIVQDQTKGARLKGIVQETVLERCAKAIGGAPDVTLTFGTFTLDQDPSGGRVARRAPDVTALALAAYRGECDLVGLFRAHHDPDVQHRLVAGGDRVAALLMAMERARIEAIGTLDFRGIAGNLAAALDQRYVRAPYVVADGTLDLQAEAMAVLARDHLVPFAPRLRRMAFVESRRGVLDAILSRHGPALVASLRHQDRYGQLVLALAADLPASAPTGGQAKAATAPIGARSDQDPGPIQADQASIGEAAGLKAQSETTVETAPRIGDPEKAAEPAGETKGAAPAESNDDATQAVRLRRRHAQEGGAPYRVFTRAYDRVVSAQTLLRSLPDCPPPEPSAVAGQRKEIRRLAGGLRRLLLAQQPVSWDKDLLEGVLDPTRLCRVVTDPTSGRFFRQAREEPFKDTVVTLLLDNSSSMRGEPLQIVALCAEIIGKAIASCGIKVEVLGFTTCNWRGGRAREAWLAAGQPADPGRVSETLHIVYKTADAPIRTLGDSLRLVGARGLHKENVDGEALEWACGRLARRPERRRLLVMISDGAPSEETTLSLSGEAGNLLETHLHGVIAAVVRRAAVELFAIGIGYDVARLYPHAVRVDTAHGLAAALAREIPRLMQPRLRSRAAA